MADEDRGDSYARSVFSPQVPVRQGLGEMAQAALRMPGAMLRDWWKWRTAQLTPEATHESVISAGGPMSAGGLGPLAGWVKGYGFHPRTGVPDRIEAGPGLYGTSEATLRANIEGTPGGYAHVGWLGGTEKSPLPGRQTGRTAGGEMERGPGLMETMKLRDEAIPYLQELGIKGVTFTPLSSGTDVATGTRIGPAGRLRLNEVLIGNKAAATPYGGHVIPFREPEFYRKPAWYEGPPPEQVAKAEAYRAGNAPPAPPVTRRGEVATEQAADRAHFNRAIQEMQRETTRLGRTLTGAEMDAVLRRTAPVTGPGREYYSEGARRGAAEEAERAAARERLETTRRQDQAGLAAEADRLALLARIAREGQGGPAEGFDELVSGLSRNYPNAGTAEIHAVAQRILDESRRTGRGGR
jgi:hypothetical protein